MMMTFLSVYGAILTICRWLFLPASSHAIIMLLMVFRDRVSGESSRLLHQDYA